MILTAATDPDLRPRDLGVYVLLYAQLDTQTYRPLKQSWLGRQVSMHRVSALRAIARLVNAGYLELGPAEGQAHTYRLTVSPPRD